jgi:hypothetical protein
MVSYCYLCKYSLILQSNTITYEYKLPKIIFTSITVPNIKEAVKFFSSNGLVHYYGTLYSKERKETAIGQCVLTFLWRLGRIWNCTFSNFRWYRNRIILFPSRSQRSSRIQLNSGLFILYKIKHWRPHRKIVSYGGKQRMPIREYYPKDKPFKMCYVEDPFQLFSKYTHSYVN